MKRLRALFLAAALTLCAAPAFLTTASALETDFDLYLDNYDENMEKVEGMEKPDYSEIEDMIADLMEPKDHQQAGLLIGILFKNFYIFTVFLFAFIFAAVQYFFYGRR